MGWLSRKYWRSSLIATDTVRFSVGLAVLLLGSKSFRVFTLGTIKVVISMKNISNRNTRSVIDDISNVALTLFLDLIAILKNDFDFTRILNYSTSSCPSV